MDEADVFYADPLAWVHENMAIRGQWKKWPEQIVMFEHLEGALESLLAERGYAECWRGFNSHWHDDWRRKGDVIVWCIKP